jgi:iron(III) transport system ATP-binding protein
MADVGTLAVSVRNLTKIYETRRGPVTALNDVSVDIRTGEMLVLLGPSGCGKTTLLRSVAGLEMPTTGEIVVRDRTVFSSEADIAVPPEKRNLSIVFQSYALWPHMTVAQNVAYPLKVSKVAKAEIDERVHKVLTLAGLDHLGTNYPSQLSGGQQQRVALARALIANDGLILFDEPLSNLDAKVRERLRDELLAMQQEFGFTAMYVTHDQVEAAALADRIAVMQVGAIAQLGTSAEVFNMPNSRYVADFVGCANEFAGTVAAASGDSLEIDTPLGRLVGTGADATGTDGAPVKVMFRPEHVHLVEGSGGPNTLAARIEHKAFLGSHIEYRLKIGGEAVLFRAMRDDFEPGADISVSIEPIYTRVFAAS